jgi:hypothetical protein
MLLVTRVLEYAFSSCRGSGSISLIHSECGNQRSPKTLWMRLNLKTVPQRNSLLNPEQLPAKVSRPSPGVPRWLFPKVLTEVRGYNSWRLGGPAAGTRFPPNHFLWSGFMESFALSCWSSCESEDAVVLLV